MLMALPKNKNSDSFICKNGEEVKFIEIFYECRTLPKAVKFAFLRFGKECNSGSGHEFSEATCNASIIRSEYNLIRKGKFEDVFRRGMEVLENLKTDSSQMNDQENFAIDVLKKFFQEKSLHEKCLRNALNKMQSEADGMKPNPLTETEMRAVFVKHLLGRLTPGQSYISEFMKHGDGLCPCKEDICDKVSNYRSTGIGHEEVWHGFVDIMFASNQNEEPETIATVVRYLEDSSEFTIPMKRKKLEEEEEDESPGEGITSEAERVVCGSEDQCIAETVVFSLLQKLHHPEFTIHLVPNIVVTSSHIRVLMYDADSDVLLCSNPVPLFDDGGGLQILAVIILWMVLHYRIFCSGINIEPGKLEQIRSRFRNFVGDKWKIYTKSLKTGVSKFPVVKKFAFPSVEDLMCGQEFALAP